MAIDRILKLHTTNMETFVILRHPVTTLVTAFNNLNKLTNDVFILKLFDKKLFIDLTLIMLLDQKYIELFIDPLSVCLLVCFSISQPRHQSAVKLGTPLHPSK